MNYGLGLLAPLRNRDYRSLWMAQSVSVAGDKLNQIAMAVLVYARTGSMVQMGVMLGVTVAPAALFSIFAGAFVDRWDRRRTLIGADVARALLVLAVPFAADLSIYAAYAIAFAVSTVSLFFEPARLALMPELLEEKELMGANSLDNATTSISELLGLAVGGAAVAALGYHIAFYVDAASFLLSALFVVAIRRTAPGSPLSAEESSPDLVGEIRESIRHVLSRPVLRDVIGVQTIAALAGFGTITLANLLALHVFEGGSQTLAAVDAAITVGLLVGSVSIARSGPSLQGRKFLGGLFAFGALCAAVGATPFLIPALGLLALTGVANMWFQIPMVTMLQRYSEPSVRGRVFAARTAVTRIAGIIGLIGAGVLAEHVGVGMAFVILGGSVVISALIGMTRPALREA